MLIAVDNVGADDTTVCMLTNLRCAKILLRTKYAAIMRGRRRQELRVIKIVIIVNSIVKISAQTYFCLCYSMVSNLYRIVR